RVCCGGVALAHGLADRFGCLVEAGKPFLPARGHRTAAFIKAEDLLSNRGYAATAKGSVKGFRIFTNGADIMHGRAMPSGPVPCPEISCGDAGRLHKGMRQCLRACLPRAILCRMIIRPETARDGSAISAITTAAFASAAHSSQTEAAIVDALREAGALTLSLVAVIEGEICGHCALSPVEINGAECGWYGLGPVSASPQHQTKGIGSALIIQALTHLRETGAKG